MSEHAFVKGEWQGDQWQPSDDDDADGMPVGPRGVSLSEDDRALLELAARAIGARFEEVDGEGYGNLHFEDGSVVYGWNSLVFHGDTFELQVRLQIMPTSGDVKCTARWWVRPGMIELDEVVELTGDDPLAATCRAVTRAAAEIGKAMS